MATRKPPPPPVQASLTVDQMRKGMARLERLIEEVEAFDETNLTKRWGPEQTTLETTIQGTLTSVFGHETVEYRRYAKAAKLDHGAVMMRFDGGATRRMRRVNTLPKARRSQSRFCGRR